ncbi:MAG: hypothetical protein NTZ24_14300 [Deltaproteobacteria bacterium]|nr:hypothetical protein [Deltaproteobacteria bacterium]
MDMQSLTPEEKQNFIIALNNLKQAIGVMLAAATKEKPGMKMEGMLVKHMKIKIFPFRGDEDFL